MKISPARKLNILVAEDDELNRILLCEILEKYGCTYQAADNGKTAVDLFLRENFDVVFMDLNMPVMDGHEAARAMREVESNGYGKTPIAALSAGVLLDEREKAFAYEMDYHFMKPYFPSQIYAFLDKLAGKTAEGIAAAGRAEEDGSAGQGQAGGYFTRDEILKVFEKIDCDIDFFETLLEKFKLSSAELLKMIRESIGRKDGLALREYAHALKGEFLIFNAMESVKTAAFLEEAGRTENYGGTVRAAEELEDQLGRIVDSFTAFLNQEKRND